MNKEFFDEFYKNGILRDCMPVALDRIGFIHKDYPEDEELNDLPFTRSTAPAVECISDSK